MNGVTHGVVGAAVGLGLAHFVQVSDLPLVVCVGAGVVGGLLPDIDHPRATISKYTPGVGHIARLFVSHRGLTHTFLFLWVLWVVSGFAHVPIVLSSSFLWSFTLHLLCDMVTPQGLPVFMPASRQAFHLLPGGLLRMPGVAWALETLTGAAALLSIGYIVLESLR